jgi:uncharacterized repeat protein (TIGR03803 family)
VQGSDGNFYGITSFGGANDGGTVFKITPSGTLTTLYNFCSQSGCADGAAPYAALVQGTDGNFYGTTTRGGANPGFYGDGGGTVFRITPGGALTTLYSFCTQRACRDGGWPVANLVHGTDGNFYGTTGLGGINGADAGTVFRVTPAGSLITLYSFCSKGGSVCADGAGPSAGLVQGSDGDFYGTTEDGGAGASCPRHFGCGTVFKITPNAALTTLYSFCSQTDCTDGRNPKAGLILGTDGNFYGMTGWSGSSDHGTVFRLTPDGVLTTLYSFCSTGGCRDGAEPEGKVLQGGDGNFYGTTSGGGLKPNNSDGTVFRLSLRSNGERRARLALAPPNVNASANNSPQTAALMGTGR